MSRSARTRTARRWAPGLAFAVLALAGCSADETPAAAPSSSPAPSSVSAGSDLTIAFDDGEGEAGTWTLTCEPAGGTHPDPTAACTALARAGATALPPVPADRMCTELYGGPQRATVTGTWDGRALDSTVTRTDGCEVARWDALEGLLPEAG